MTVTVKPRGWTVPGQAVTDWAPLPLGAGGWITGVDQVSDVIVAKTDTYGAYVKTGSTWTQMFTSSRVPVADRLPNTGDAGVYDIRIAPTDSTLFYAIWKDTVFKSTDSGATWTATALDTLSVNPNDDYRYMNYKMAIDPSNADVVWVGETGGSVYYTDDGGATWTTHATLPAANATGYRIAFDDQSTVTGSKTQKLYVWVGGSGLYQSTNGGTSFTLMNTSGAPTTQECRHLEVASDGSTSTDSTIFVCCSNGLYRWSGSAWSNPITDSNITPGSVAISPLDANHIVGVRAQGGGSLIQSDDNGVTWGSIDWSPTRASADIAWHTYPTMSSSWATGNIVFDSTGKLWHGQGIGVWYCTPTGAGQSPVSWTGQSEGIEQLVVNGFKKIPGGDLLCYCWDRATFRVNSDMSTYPTRYFPNSTNLEMTWHLDVAPDGTVVHVTNWSNQLSGKASGDLSSSGSWTNFAALPPNSPFAGNIAVSQTDSDRIVWAMVAASSANDGVYYTNDGGSTWTAATLPGLTNPGTTFDNWVQNRQNLVSDPAGNFVLYHNSTTAGENGFWRRAAGGDTWVKMLDRTAAASQGTWLTDQLYWANFNVTLRAPAEDDLWFGPGHSGSTPDNLTTPDDKSFLMRSTDGGTNWTQITNAREPYKFGFGKAAPGNTYPTLYMIGWVTFDSGSTWTYGVWMSTDADSGATPTWTNIGTYPLGIMDGVTDVQGDPDIYGRVYVGFRGTGAAWRQAA